MELTYMDGDNERQWFAQANSELRSKLRAIEQVIDNGRSSGDDMFDTLKRIREIVSS